MRTAAGAVALIVVAFGLEQLEAGERRHSSQDLDRPPALRLAWFDATVHGAGAEGVVWAEARSILEDAGVDVTWRRALDGEEARPGEIGVILIDRVLVDRGSRRPILGVTVARTPRLVWVHVGSVRAVLGIAQGWAAHALPAAKRRDLSVALGRVVAHEVVHSIAPSVDHGDGLMSSALTRVQLTKARVSLDPVLALSLRAELRSGPAPPSGGTATFTAVEGAVKALPLPRVPPPGWTWPAWEGPPRPSP